MLGDAAGARGPLNADGGDGVRVMPGHLRAAGQGRVGCAVDDDGAAGVLQAGAVVPEERAGLAVEVLRRHQDDACLGTGFRCLGPLDSGGDAPVAEEEVFEARRIGDGVGRRRLCLLGRGGEGGREEEVAAVHDGTIIWEGENGW